MYYTSLRNFLLISIKSRLNIRFNKPCSVEIINNYHYDEIEFVFVDFILFVGTYINYYGSLF